MSDIHWYAAQTFSGMEVTADENLRHQGFTTFFPTLRIRKRRRKPGTTVQQDLWVVSWEDEPRFSRYTFVMAGSDEDLAAILRTRAVVTLVATPGHPPTPIPDKLMDALMARCDEERPVDYVRRDRLDAGTMFEISEENPFAGLIAQIEVDLGKKIIAECFGKKIELPPEAIGRVLDPGRV